MGQDEKQPVSGADNMSHICLLNFGGDHWFTSSYRMTLAMPGDRLVRHGSVTARLRRSQLPPPQLRRSVG